MRLTDLALVDFRSHAQAVLRLGEGVTAFVGGNGQGKTNLVEAVAYLATLSSHRVATTAPLVRHGAERAQIRAKLVRGDRAVVVDVELTPGRAVTARLGKTKVKAAAILGVTRVVAFVPEDLSLVKGGPETRRRYLDELLVQLRPGMAGVLADYDRVTRQRTALLKTLGARGGGDAALAALDVWDERAAALGGRVTASRMALAADLAPLVAEVYGEIAGDGSATLAYEPSVEVPARPTVEEATAALARTMSTGRVKEIERGAPLAGPQREDVALGLRGLPARGYASHGESWSLALALRIGSFRLMRQDVEDDPILILDDVFAELDEARREAVTHLVDGVEQVLVTAAVPTDVPDGLSAVRYRLDGGLISADGAGGEDMAGGGSGEAEAADD
jgi:DNA replication and repair protein RecF